VTILESVETTYLPGMRRAMFINDSVYVLSHNIVSLSDQVIEHDRAFSKGRH